MLFTSHNTIACILLLTSLLLRNTNWPFYLHLLSCCNASAYPSLIVLPYSWMIPKVIGNILYNIKWIRQYLMGILAVQLHWHFEYCSITGFLTFRTQVLKHLENGPWTNLVGLFFCLSVNIELFVHRINLLPVNDNKICTWWVILANKYIFAETYKISILL